MRPKRAQKWHIFSPIHAQAKIFIFGPIELYFTAKMGFFGVGSSFMTFFTTFEYVFSPYPVYPVGILGVFWVYPVGIPFLVQLSSTLQGKWGFLGWGVHF